MRRHVPHLSRIPTIAAAKHHLPLSPSPPGRVMRGGWGGHGGVEMRVQGRGSDPGFLRVARQVNLVSFSSMGGIGDGVHAYQYVRTVPTTAQMPRGRLCFHPPRTLEEKLGPSFQAMPGQLRAGAVHMQVQVQVQARKDGTGVASLLE